MKRYKTILSIGAAVVLTITIPTSVLVWSALNKNSLSDEDILIFELNKIKAENFILTTEGKQKFASEITNENFKTYVQTPKDLENIKFTYKVNNFDDELGTLKIIITATDNKNNALSKIIIIKGFNTLSEFLNTNLNDLILNTNEDISNVFINDLTNENLKTYVAIPESGNGITYNLELATENPFNKGLGWVNVIVSATKNNITITQEKVVKGFLSVKSFLEKFNNQKPTSEDLIKMKNLLFSENFQRDNIVSLLRQKYVFGIGSPTFVIDGLLNNSFFINTLGLKYFDRNTNDEIPESNVDNNNYQNYRVELIINFKSNTNFGFNLGNIQTATVNGELGMDFIISNFSDILFLNDDNLSDFDLEVQNIKSNDTLNNENYTDYRVNDIKLSNNGDVNKVNNKKWIAYVSSKGISFDTYLNFDPNGNLGGQVNLDNYTLINSTVTTSTVFSFNLFELNL